MNYPYDDTNMVYDYTLHGYKLTVEGARELAGVDLATYLDSTGDFNPSTMPTRSLLKLARHLYHWIYSQIPAENKHFIERLLATYPPCRDIIQECLVNELEYALFNGNFWDYATNDLAEWKSVSEDTRHILSEPLPNGIVILSVEFLPFGVPAAALHVGY